MNFSVSSGSPTQQKSQCIIAGVFESRKLSPSAKALDDASGGMISDLINRGELEGKLGQTLLLYNVPNVGSERILLIGVGKEKELNTNAFRQANVVMAKTLAERGATEALCCLTELKVKNHADDYAWNIRQAILAIEDGLYRFEQLKSEKDTSKRLLQMVVFNLSDANEVPKAEQAAREGMAIAAAITSTKDLANLPGNICTPNYLAEQARSLGKTYPQLRVSVLDEADMEELKMGALLSVTRGSQQDAKLITMEYQGGSAEIKPIVLVGKGVTFDSGGISIKPGEAMDEMKYDMCGAATVLGVLHACAELKLPINVVGVIPATENLPDGKASKPGDVVTSMSGLTIEILNTDAEGRLILCDALTYCKKFDPDVVIDIATLTGACIIALGNHTAGVLGTHHGLIHELLSAGKIAADPCWELPLGDEYQEQLKSNFADIANIGGRPAGTITAACFLSRFTKEYRWAHLDIAGVAWKSGKEKGATGRPVPLLMQYILNRCNM